MSKAEQSQIEKKLWYKILKKIINSGFRLYYYFKYKDYFNRHHLKISLEKDFNLSIQWFTHDQYLEYKEEILLKAKKKYPPEEFIQFALDGCKQCNFLIFDCGSENKYIQFWYGDGKLMADWAIKKTFPLTKYTYQMLGVLNEIGIHERTETSKKSRRIPYYEKRRNGDFITYQIYFQKYPEDAITYILTMFEKVFKQKIDRIKVRIG